MLQSSFRSIRIGPRAARSPGAGQYLADGSGAGMSDETGGGVTRLDCTDAPVPGVTLADRAALRPGDESPATLVGDVGSIGMSSETVAMPFGPAMADSGVTIDVPGRG